MLARGFCVSRKGGTEGGGTGGGGTGGRGRWESRRWVRSPAGDMHMVAARLGFKRGIVGTGWATSCPDCMDRLYDNRYADYCMLVDEWMRSKS